MVDKANLNKLSDDELREHAVHGLMDSGNRDRQEAEKAIGHLGKLSDEDRRGMMELYASAIRDEPSGNPVQECAQDLVDDSEPGEGTPFDDPMWIEEIIQALMERPFALEHTGRKDTESYALCLRLGGSIVSLRRIIRGSPIKTPRKVSDCMNDVGEALGVFDN